MPSHTPSRREAILDAAEALFREGGYHAVSTRAVAGRVGIRAASLHHHFPSKVDLGTAVAERYRRRFVEGLGDPARFGGDARAVTAAFGSAFAEAAGRDGRLCLCAVLGAESESLPEPVARETGRFFDACLLWLAEALAGQPDAGDRALGLLSALEGAMIVGRARGRADTVRRVAAWLDRA